MRSLFKASLVAAAVVAAGTASAGKLEVVELSLSKQGAAAQSSTHTTTANDIKHTVEKGYSVNDEITFTMTAGSAASNTWPATMSYASCGTIVAGTCGAGTMISSLFTVSADNTEAVYRVNTVTADATAGETTIGAFATLTSPNAIEIKTNAIGLAPVTLGAKSKATNGSEFDPVTTVTLADSVDQFGDIMVADADKLDQEISVASTRKGFTSGTTDTLTWTATNNTGLTLAATVRETEVVLAGDFGALPNTAFVSAAGGTAVYVNADKELTLTYAANVTTDTLTITPDGVAELVRQNNFKVTGEREFGATATKVTESIGSAAAGEWTLDGALVNIPYMPFQEGVSQIIYVTNTGTNDGEIAGTAFDENGTSYDLPNLGTVKAGSVLKITKAVKDALANAGMGAGKASITLTVNALDKDITVYSAYKVGTDRGFVNTDQYKGK